MDFIIKLSRKAWGVDYVWVIGNKLTKSDHFYPIAETISSEILADIYVLEMVLRHEVSVSVVSDLYVRFTSRFWRMFHEELLT